MQCEMCDKIINNYVDGKTKSGIEAIMCLECHRENGCGLGIGKGTMYTWNGSIYVRVETGVLK